MENEFSGFWVPFDKGQNIEFLYGTIQLVLTQNFPKNNISYPLICTGTCAYHGIRNFSFSEFFTYVLHEWSLWCLEFRDAFRTHSNIKDGVFCFRPWTAFTKISLLDVWLDSKYASVISYWELLTYHYVGHKINNCENFAPLSWLHLTAELVKLR